VPTIRRETSRSRKDRSLKPNHQQSPARTHTVPSGNGAVIDSSTPAFRECSSGDSAVVIV
jgi:hypothetical protein